jgi:Smg protein
MKENVFEVLMYLFENYMDDETKIETNQELLKTELKQAGFLHSEINKALEWLESLVSLKEKILPHAAPQKHSIRIFSNNETQKLSMECQGFLLFLEQVGVLDETTRELVIDRAMALETKEFSIDHLKWVILMVLFNQPGHEEAFVWMEDMVLDMLPNQLH